MLERKKLRDLNDFFLELNARKETGVYFYRINGYNEAVKNFIVKYYEAARSFGVVIEGKIPNPDEKNLAYYEEIMGMDFFLNVGFLEASLKKWLPRMNARQRNAVAVSVYDTLDGLKKAGKNENMLKNAYIKFMCWLYYKFERIVNRLGENGLPKILYEGEVGNYELLLLSVLSKAGCDIVLLQYKGDGAYRKKDASGIYSDEYTMPGMEPYPAYFNLKYLREEMQKQTDQKRLYRAKPRLSNCTNAWIKGTGLEDIKKDARARGESPELFYNCFYRISGVEDKLTYQNELYQFWLSLKNSGRKIVIAEKEIPKPAIEEISAVRRKHYTRNDQMLSDLSLNIQFPANTELQNVMQKAFLDVLMEESAAPGMNLNKLTNKAVYLLCWFKRYLSPLFANWSMPKISCFLYLGGVKSGNEALFLKFLAKLPVDVAVLKPDVSEPCCLKDSVLFEKTYKDSMTLETFPKEQSNLQMGTAAYQAERELDTLMYQDTGIYRDRQYAEANAISLRTTYEEIRILWDQELKYRPNFGTAGSVVSMPVIFAKASGVKDGQLQTYWTGIKALLTGDTIVLKNTSYMDPAEPNPIRAHVTAFLKNKRLHRAKLREHPAYPYGFLREEMQEHLLDKLQLLLDQKLIRGTFENGMEYTILSVALGMKKDLTRMIQKFDFTKKNPKLVFIHTTEQLISLEDSILAAYLNLVGFDILFFVPTGYQGAEKYYNMKILEEHQVGEYIYDLQIPDFSQISSSARLSWREKIFKRGN
ncbi:MAG: hypothetical protein HFI84_09185 [Eubacterium sp.]|nr:hypothetical protein [Eubacterium sp.]